MVYVCVCVWCFSWVCFRQLLWVISGILGHCSQHASISALSLLSTVFFFGSYIQPEECLHALVHCTLCDSCMCWFESTQCRFYVLEKELFFGAETHPFSKERKTITLEKEHNYDLGEKVGQGMFRQAKIPRTKHAKFNQRQHSI